MIPKQLLFSSCLAFLLVSCASHDQLDTHTDHVDVSKTKTTSKDETITWNTQSRRGAAYSEQGYRHVLADRNVGTLHDQPAEPTISDNPIEVLKRTTSLKSYSVYEMARWERFCGHGKMDSKDWEFVATEGRENIPEVLRSNCSAPAYTRQQYIAAWKSSCSSVTSSPYDQAIRNSTVAPPAVCDE